ncbi:hypothetical protein Peur_066757 [Populus x canadensis]
MELPGEKTGLPVKAKGVDADELNFIGMVSQSFRAKNSIKPKATKIPAVLVSETAGTEKKSDPPERIVTIVGSGSISPVKCTPRLTVKSYIGLARLLLSSPPKISQENVINACKKIEVEYEMLVFTDDQYQSKDQTETLLKALSCADILLIVAITDQESVKWIQTEYKSLPKINETSGYLLEKHLEFLSQKTSDSTDAVQTKNNCLELAAKVPEKPYVSPMAKTAEVLFVGERQKVHFGTSQFSRTVLFSPDGAYPAEKESKRLVSKFLQIGEYRIVVKILIVPNAKAKSTSLKEMGIIGPGSGKT